MSDTDPATDLERFVALYKDFGIECEVEEINMGEDLDDKHFVIVLWGGTEEIEGYSGFYTRTEFDYDGKFIKQGFWE